MITLNTYNPKIFGDKINEEISPRKLAFHNDLKKKSDVSNLNSYITWDYYACKDMGIMGSQTRSQQYRQNHIDQCFGGFYNLVKTSIQV